MKNKQAFEMSFQWIFAFVAGGAILLLALYGMSRIIQTGQNLGQTEAAVALTALLDPLETGLASDKGQAIKLNTNTKIFFTCSYLDNKPFGKQTIAFSEKDLNNQYSGKTSSLSEDNEKKGQEIEIKNKYIFSDNVIEGKNIYAFSIPFFLPFKIGDIIIIGSKDYCFYQPPNEIKYGIENLEFGNLKIANDLKNCTGIVVCFDGDRQECEIKVYSNNGDYNSGRVIKNLQEVKYRDGLIYGAIFSSKEMYECNLKRLMARLGELIDIYSEKAEVLNKKGCGTDIKFDLNLLKTTAIALNSSRDLIDLDDNSKKVESFNKGLMTPCKLY